MAKYEFKFPVSSLSGLIRIDDNVDGLVFCNGVKRQYVRVHVKPDPNRLVSEKEQKNRDNFKNAIVLWRNLLHQEKDLYKKFSYQTTKNKSCGWNEFVKDYIKWAHIYNVLELSMLFKKMFELWGYDGDIKVTKDYAFEKAIEYVAGIRNKKDLEFQR